jgi:hypothetical protein
MRGALPDGRATAPADVEWCRAVSLCERRAPGQ